MSGLSNTQYFKVKTEPEIQVKEVLETVYNAMVEKGYVRRPDLYHKLQGRQKSDHES